MKKILKILLGILTLLLLLTFLKTWFVEPWLGRKIHAELFEKIKDYRIEIGKVHILIFTSGIELEGITVNSNYEQGEEGYRDVNLVIASAKFKGISLVKAMFKKDIRINEIIISNSTIKGKIPFSGKTKSQPVSPVNIRIGGITFNKIDLVIVSNSSAQSYTLKEGVLMVSDLQVEKQDTLSPGIIKKFVFQAEKLASVSPDSMYSYTADGIFFSTTSNTLVVDSFSVQPNYNDYDFTSRHEFQALHIEAGFSKIYARDLNVSGYFASKCLISTYVEIGKMDMKVFRDKRKEFRHVRMPTFQDMIYSYPGAIQIDSIGLKSGNVTYTVHDEKANKPGRISFNEISAKIYQITNDTIYKTEIAFLELKGDALLMGKGKMTVLLKGRIFDNLNTFSLKGSLSGMEADALNPILGKNAFIYATSGKIDAMHYSFTANNVKATGKMILLYHGLDIAVKNKRTDDTTAFKERFLSFIVNRRVLDSNPIPDEDVREGIIDYDRDPERFLFGYCFKSILSGIMSSLAKNPKKKMIA